MIPKTEERKLAILDVIKQLENTGFGKNRVRIYAKFKNEYPKLKTRNRPEWNALFENMKCDGLIKENDSGCFLTEKGHEYYNQSIKNNNGASTSDDRSIMIEAEQERLLIQLVEANRCLPENSRLYFYVAHQIGPPGVVIKHPGMPKDAPRVFEGDLRTLASENLISIASMNTNGIDSFYITPLGFQTYQQLIEQSGTPLERVQNSVIEYLNSDKFKSSYATAYDKWMQAEKLLWGKDTEQVLTTIGHLVRESMQEFADALVQHFNPPDIPSDKAKTVARIRAVLNKVQIESETEKAFLDALLAYWGTVSDLVQRQEHGAQKEGSALLWCDARRVVFQSAVLMFELDNSLSVK